VSFTSHINIHDDETREPFPGVGEIRSLVRSHAFSNFCLRKRDNYRCRSKRDDCFVISERYPKNFIQITWPCLSELLSAVESLRCMDRFT